MALSDDRIELSCSVTRGNLRSKTDKFCGNLYLEQNR